MSLLHWFSNRCTMLSKTHLVLYPVDKRRGMIEEQRYRKVLDAGGAKNRLYALLHSS